MREGSAGIVAERVFWGVLKASGSEGNICFRGV